MTMKMTMAEFVGLKPCPFCGGKAEKLTSIDGFTSIGCLNCNPFYGVMIQRNTEAEAIAAWNSRAAMEFDNWFYLPKPKEPIVEVTGTTHAWDGTKIKTDVFYQVQEQAVINWAKELDEHIIKRICEVWNSRADYHGYEQAAIEAWESIKAWNSRTELGSKPPYDELLRCLENDWNIRASWDGLRKFWSIELTEEGVKLRDAAHGTLTAEQVREAVLKRGNVMGPRFYGDWQAIADELNAAWNSRAERTCKMETDHDELEAIAYSHEDTWAYKCSACDWSFRYDRGIKPNYCPNCGAKITPKHSEILRSEVGE